MGLLKSIATVGGFTLISRVLGFIRDILIAGLLGAGTLADVFFVAFKLPNLFRRLFAEGAFNAAFVPIFSGLIETDGKNAAQEFAEEALAGLLWTLLGFVVLFELLMPFIMVGFAPGFMGNAAKFDLAVLLTRITFPYLLFISLVSLMGGVLNSLGRFAAAAATPIFLNICLIGAILVLTTMMPTAAHALSWGVAGAGVVQFVWLYQACARAGMRLRFRRPRMTARVKTLLFRMLPLAVGAGIYQVNLLIDTILASLLPDGSISYLFFADRLNQFPLGVIGLAVGTALLPLLSRQVKRGEQAAAMHSQNRALEFSLLLTLPAAAALMVMAEPVIRTLFERGAFGAGETSATAAALVLYASGLPAYVLVKSLAVGFFAREDTATPIKIGFAAVLVNIVLSIALMGPFLHVGLAAASAISAWVNALTLAVVLSRRGQLQLDDRLRRRFPRALAASALMAGAVWWLAGSASAQLAAAEPTRAMALALVILFGAAIYAGAAWAFGAASPNDLKRLYRGGATP